MSSYQLLIVAICFILNFNDGIDVLLVSFTGPEIASEWLLSKAELGYIFSAGLVGMTAGCFLLAPFGDRIGRRNVFLISLSLISAGMLLVYVAGSYTQLLCFRVITGLGIGGILPNLATVAAEFSNNRRRDFYVGLIQAGWPLGAIITGFFTAWAVPRFGWRFGYLAAGTVSSAMLVAVYFYLPESLFFLAAKQPGDAGGKIKALLKRLGHDGAELPPAGGTVGAKASVRELFSGAYSRSTILLWLAIFFGFITLYSLMSWVPSIARESGMPFELATLTGTALNFGAFTGVAVMGYCISRFPIKRVLVSFMGIAFVIMLLFGNFSLSYVLMFVLTFLIGFFVQGGFNIFYPIATRIYPDTIRSTGVGWAMGVGRFGAILGPALFGIFSDMGVSLAARFTLFSLPLVIAALLAWRIPSRELD